VFPDDLSRMPPERTIEFKIKLQPSTTPVAKAPYKMSPIELAELKIQLQDFAGQRFYSPKFIILGLSNIVCVKEI
jgi:hypothetical protein